MGKYTKALANAGAKRTWGTDENTHQDQIELVKGRFIEAWRTQHGHPPNAQDLVRVYGDLRVQKEKFDEEEKILNMQLAAIGQLVVTQYENEKTTTIKLQTGETLRVEDAPHAIVEDRDKFRQWCIDNDMLRELNLAWQTTNSILKELLLKGVDAPPGIGTFFKSKIVYSSPDKPTQLERDVDVPF